MTDEGEKPVTKSGEHRLETQQLRKDVDKLMRDTGSHQRFVEEQIGELRTQDAKLIAMAEASIAQRARHDQEISMNTQVIQELLAETKTGNESKAKHIEETEKLTKEVRAAGVRLVTVIQSPRIVGLVALFAAFGGLIAGLAMAIAEKLR